jgi:FixJ family two-component response regulator
MFTDAIMPVMSGKELYDQLISLYPHVKAIFVSGYTENAIAHHGIPDEGVNFIQKPFKILKLPESVQRVLDS